MEKIRIRKINIITWAESLSTQVILSLVNADSSCRAGSRLIEAALVFVHGMERLRGKFKPAHLQADWAGLVCERAVLSGQASKHPLGTLLVSHASQAAGAPESLRRQGSASSACQR